MKIAVCGVLGLAALAIATITAHPLVWLILAIVAFAAGCTPAFDTRTHS